MPSTVHLCKSAAGGRSRVSSAAFTLTEVIVAMTVSLILIVTLLQIFNTATGTWQRGEAEADAFREARGALQLMARDLSTTISASYALPPAGGNAAATVPPLVPTLVLNRYSSYIENSAQQTSTDPADQQINEEVYCLADVSSPPASVSPTPATSPSSITGQREVCAIGYFCQWLPDVATNATTAPAAYGLMRQYLNGDGTFLRFKEASPPSGTTTSTPLSFAAIYTRAQVSLIPPTNPQPDVGQCSELAAYIFDLKFRIDTDLVIPAGASAYDNGEATPPVDHSTPALPYSDSPTGIPPQLPAFIEIRFKALSTNIGRRLEGNTTVTPADWVSTSPSAQKANSVYQTLIRPHSEQFILRVPLVNAPPAPSPTPSP